MESRSAPAQAPSSPIPKQAPFSMKPDITFKSCHPNDFKFNSKISVQVSATVFKTSFQFRISIYGIRAAGDGWVTNENHLEDLNRRLPTVATLAFCYDLDRGRLTDHGESQAEGVRALLVVDQIFSQGVGILNMDVTIQCIEEKSMQRVGQIQLNGRPFGSPPKRGVQHETVHFTDFKARSK